MQVGSNLQTNQCIIFGWGKLHKLCDDVTIGYWTTEVHILVFYLNKMTNTLQTGHITVLIYLLHDTDLAYRASTHNQTRPMLSLPTESLKL